MTQKKMYYVDNDGNLRVVKILSESIVEGATLPSCLVKYDDGSKAITSKDYFFESEVDAYRSYVEDVEEDLKAYRRQAADIKAEISRLIGLLSTATSKLVATQGD